MSDTGICEASSSTDQVWQSSANSMVKAHEKNTGFTQHHGTKKPLRNPHSLRIPFEGAFHRSQSRHHTAEPFHPHQHLCGPHSRPEAKRNALGIFQSIVSKRPAPLAPLSRDSTDISRLGSLISSASESESENL